MKKIKSILSSAFITVITSIFLVGCKGEPACPSAKESTHYMIDSHKKIIPYNGNDTLLFLLNNDSITCIGNGKETFFEKNAVRESNPDCNVYYTTNYEAYSTDYENFKFEHTSLEYKVRITLTNLLFEFDDIAIGKSYTKYYDSLEVNTKYYYQVSEFPAVDNSGSIFINRANGILKIIDQKNNVTWSKL